MIYLSLKGIPYEIGFQHGKRLRDLIYYNVRFICAVYDRDKQPDSKLLKKYSERLENEFPEISEELKGISDGSGISFEKILLLNFSPVLKACSNMIPSY